MDNLRGICPGQGLSSVIVRMVSEEVITQGDRDITFSILAGVTFPIG